MQQTKTDPDFCFDTGPLLFSVEKDELDQLTEFNSLVLIHNDNHGELLHLLKKRNKQNFNDLGKKWIDFKLRNSLRIRNETGVGCIINRDVSRNFCDFLYKNELKKVAIIRTSKYHSQLPASWFRYQDGNSYVLTNNFNYKNVPYFASLLIEEADFSAFMLAYSRCYRGGTAILVTNEQELSEFTSHFTTPRVMLIPLFLFNIFEKVNHNPETVLRRIKKFIYWKSLDTNKFPKYYAKYWKSILDDTKDVIIHVIAILIEFSRCTKSENVISYMRDIDIKVTENLNNIRTMENRAFPDIESILGKYKSLFDDVESCIRGFDVDGWNNSKLTLWVKTL